MEEARCPVCGKVYHISDSGNRWAVEGLFLKHKDACTVPGEGEYVRVVSMVARVVSVDLETEEFPLVEVVKPSGRHGVYRLGALGRVRDQDAAAERFLAMVPARDRDDG